MAPQLCLGTAQFGQAYGITNASGQVPEPEVADLLAQAANAGIRLLDTAQAYGAAEAVLGRTLPVEHGFQLISKLPAQPQVAFSSEDPSRWELAFRASCERLGLRRLEALLLHSSPDLSKPGGEHLRQWLLSLRERGLVRRLGVSIYGRADLEAVPPELLDLVQLPLSLYDQRLLNDGTIAGLRRQGVAIHARSVYLQGLLLTPAQYWPEWILDGSRQHHQRLAMWALECETTLLELALGFAKAQSHLEAVVVGLCSARELSELQAAWASPLPECLENEWRTWALEDSALLDPRCWPN